MEAESRSGRVRTLVVDDDPADCMALAGSLSQHGMRAVACGTAAAAFAALEKGDADLDPYRIVILGRQLRGIKGELVGKAIRSDPRYRDMLLVLLYPTAPVSDDCRVAPPGFSAVVSKRDGYATLIDTLKQLCAAPGSRRRPLAAIAGAPASAVDHDGIAATQAFYGLHFVELATLFLESGPTRLASMRQAGARGDAATLARLAHLFGGSCAALGAGGLARQCLQLEKIASAGVPADFAVRMAAIDAAYAGLAARLRSMSQPVNRKA
jgi:CheY-like chemotaxis protein/HPt (histidine-containing phosphotransfer) domain-containing protein